MLIWATRGMKFINFNEGKFLRFPTTQGVMASQPILPPPPKKKDVTPPPRNKALWRVYSFINHWFPLEGLIKLCEGVTFGGGGGGVPWLNGVIP